MTTQTIEEKPKSNLEMEFCIMSMLMDRLWDVKEKDIGTEKIAVCEQWRRFSAMLKSETDLY